MQVMDKPLGMREATMMNPLQLAYIGDAVWDLLVRSALIASGHNVRNLHKRATGLVNAAAQAQALHRVELMLTEQESDLVRRGRNAKAHHPSPKNQSAADYSLSTGFEALIGFLYLTDNRLRIKELFAAAHKEEACQESS